MIAASVAELIPQSCAKCRRHPSLKEAWGCLTPQPAAVETLIDDDGTQLDFHSCPMLFVPSTVWEWFERFQYREKFQHTAKAYDEIDPRFHAFERTYRSRLADYRARMAEQGGVN